VDSSPATRTIPVLVRKNKLIPYLGPDGKAQVTVEYENGKPCHVTAVVVSNQHDEGINHARIEKDIIKHVVKPVCGKWLTAATKFYINPTGKFVVGGPYADAGLTGRKIIVDTYGGMGRHGGGAFSGKDPSKVDRSGAYAARYIAKNLVAAGLSTEVEVQLAYAIGQADPVSVSVNTFGKELTKLNAHDLEQLVRKNFPLRPYHIIRDLALKNPIYQSTASYGHMGRNSYTTNGIKFFPWEETNKAGSLR